MLGLFLNYLRRWNLVSLRVILFLTKFLLVKFISQKTLKSFREFNWSPTHPRPTDLISLFLGFSLRECLRVFV